MKTQADGMIPQVFPERLKLEKIYSKPFFYKKKNMCSKKK